jgi:hypothetical protein
MSKQYKIVVGNTVAVPVVGSHTDEKGKPVPFKFTLICKRLNAEELKVALDGGEAKVDEFVTDVVTGWRTTSAWSWRATIRLPNFATMHWPRCSIFRAWACSALPRI